jgi:bifunctional isochorismate lyase/aryl carrier protein
VIYTAQPGGQSAEQRGLLQDFWGPGLTEDPAEERIADEVSPGERDIVLTKRRYSAFYGTELSDVLLERDRDQLIVCGVYAHIGCLMTACDAFMRDLQPFFVADALADFSAEHHGMALNYAAQRCAFVTSTRRLLDELPEGGGFPTPELVREHVAEVLYEPPSEIAYDEDLTLRGLDSVRIMSLVERWREAGIEVSFVELAERPTLTDWWRLLSSRSPQAASTPRS